MRIFADTNFLVSAFATRGLSADVFQLILAERQLMTGEFVLTELQRVLTKKLKLPQRFASDADQLLRRYHVEPIPDKLSDVQVRDEDDRWVLESAIRANAEVLITGDKDLLDISGNVPQLKILTPRGFWELIQK